MPDPRIQDGEGRERKRTTRCPERAKFDSSGHWAKHVASYDDKGFMILRDNSPLLSYCGACGVRIFRRHSTSAQWFPEVPNAD